MRNPPHIAIDDPDDRASNGDAQSGRYPGPTITLGAVNTTVSKAPEMQLARPPRDEIRPHLPGRLYCNPGARFHARDSASIQFPKSALNKELFVTTKQPSREVGSPRIKPPIMTAAILVAIAVYLSIAGVIHVLTSPDATAAVMRDISMSRMLTAHASPVPVPPRRELAGQGAEPSDNSRKCTPSKAFAATCNLN